ncbi:hypothetical protein IEQ44_05650 [Nocardioides sp. Y6]|uniref:Uncharacterized protein n=1 Tax=Nocardioides malaquae TaxID=2773426 RepID=A0ABR9RRE3_9ACTN|nr:hypothetical protein [Nocardioides malaquae]MBE7324129.1 hypothetical protein [Nocardioides malaquae]
MSDRRPGRRAAPKPSRLEALKAARRGRSGGRRVAAPGEISESSTTLPRIDDELVAPAVPPAEPYPEQDPLDLPLLDTDPFGIKAALAAMPTADTGPVPTVEPGPVAPPVVEVPTQSMVPAAVTEVAATVPGAAPEASPGAPPPVLPPVSTTDPDFKAPEGYVAESLTRRVLDDDPATPPDAAAVARRRGARVRLTFWSCVLLAGIMLLAAAALHSGPEWLDGAGAVMVLTTYAWAVMARTGGRQVVFSVLALVVGVVTLVTDAAVLRSGAAVLTCVVSALLAVVITVPARNFLVAVREVVVATAVASVGAFATVGFEPVASTTRFGYVTLVIGFVLMFALVWRFAAGLHGLGTRGLAIIVVGSLVVAASLVYTELLSRYGGSGFAQSGEDLAEWFRSTIGAVPRMLTIFLGVPALVWGVHMRARRRQGWWVCAFGVAATLPVSQRLVNIDISYVEAGLQTAYSVALGLLVGFVIIRVDLTLSGQRGARARAAEEAHAVRPEPARFSSL